MSDWRVIQGCPAHKGIAPFIYIVTHDANAVVNSINRSTAAAPILHRHGHHTQQEVIDLHAAGVKGYGPANPVNETTHCLFSDGIAFPAYPKRHPLPWWCQGFDVNDGDVGRVIRVAKHNGWVVFQPYHSGEEYHHLCFKHKPVPHTHAQRLRIAHLRATLPRR